MQGMEKDITPEKKRVPVLMRPDDHKLIETAANRIGLDVSTYMRAEAIKAARRDMEG